MDAVSQISYTQQPFGPQKKRNKQEVVTTGIGGAAAAGQARQMAAKRGLLGENFLTRGLKTVTDTQRTVNKNAEAATGLLGTFKNNIKEFSAHLVSKLQGFKGPKFIKLIVDNPITRKVAGFFGGVLAFFVLVTGVNKAVKTGALAVDDFKKQYNEFKNVA